MRIDRKTITFKYAGWFDAEIMCQLTPNILRYQFWGIEYASTHNSNPVFALEMRSWNDMNGLLFPRIFPPTRLDWCDTVCGKITRIYTCSYESHAKIITFPNSRTEFRNFEMKMCVVYIKIFATAVQKSLNSRWFVESKCKVIRFTKSFGSNCAHPVRWCACVCVLIDRHTMWMVFIFLWQIHW